MTRTIMTVLSGGILLLITSFTLGAGHTDVADAAMKGDKAALRYLIQQKADVNAPQVDGATAVHWAVYRDDAEALDMLIAAGARVDVANREGVTPLHMASLYGHAAVIEMLLKARANVKQKGPAGETMLMLAARNGNPDTIKLLLSAGADVNAREPVRGTTALMWAVEQRHPAAVKALLDGGADFAMKSGGAGLPRNYMSGKVNTAAVEAAALRHMRAAAAGRTYEEQLKIEGVGGRFGGTDRSQLQVGQQGQGQRGGQRGGQQGQRPTNANAPPAAAAAGAEDDNDQDVIIAGLVGTGGGGLTALTLAGREGDIESARLLLDKGANVNQVTEYGWSPLLTATNNRHYKLAEYLVERGADVNLANKGNWTPVYLATDNRNIEGGDFPVPKPDIDHLDYIKFLLEHGADPNARARDNTLTRTIFTMQWFLESGATPFVRGAQSSDIELLKLLLKYGADPLLGTDFGDTALTAAAGIGWVEGVTYEHSQQANVDTVKLLLELGLDPNAANQDGRTPLMGAAMKGRNAVVQMLVDQGARLDQRDKGSRDTDTVVSVNAGHTWQAVDYADGLVRVGVQSAIARPETGALIRKLMAERGLSFPPTNRTVYSVCVVELCKERVPAGDQPQK
ncbi:MAG TPA: ankyrin repeat domain-containing protein [Terriglobia bacterium]|nr:ankyrin repeat domain-containing protein [Terriglobia bacterium]